MQNVSSSIRSTKLEIEFNEESLRVNELLLFTTDEDCTACYTVFLSNAQLVRLKEVVDKQVEVLKAAKLIIEHSSKINS